jgi:hypothetical protein
MAAAADPDSDAEDDPGQLLNLWLGELNTLKKVRGRSDYVVEASRGKRLTGKEFPNTGTTKRR